MGASTNDPFDAVELAATVVTEEDDVEERLEDTPGFDEAVATTGMDDCDALEEEELFIDAAELRTLFKA